MAKLYFRYGAMNCGKSTNVIQTAYNFFEKGKKALLIKPSIDTKGEDTVVNRTGLSRKVDVLLKPEEKVRNYLTEDTDAIIVDEAEFLTIEQVKELYQITKLDDIPVLCFGLRANFKMEPFPASIYLLTYADEITELKSICKCGKKATHNMRLYKGVPIFEGEDVLIDGSLDDITYEGVCGKCMLEYFLEWKKGKEQDHPMIRERKIK